MNSPLDFKSYQILKIDYTHTPSDKELPIDGKIPDPIPDIRVNSENKNEFIVTLNSKIVPETDKEAHQCPISLEIEVVGFFELVGEIEEEERSFHMGVSAPSMVFGIIRSWVSQITANSGFSPILLPSVQFGKVEEEEGENGEEI
ncbi:MAG: protein-export chaperone SecB [Bacteroidales bacterium]